MSLRVAQILDEKRPGATRVWRPAPILVVGLSVACLMVFSDGPRLVSFEPSSAGSPAAASAVPSSAIDRIPDFGARVVPAKFVVSSSQQNSGSVPAKIVPANIKAKSNKKMNASRPSVLRAKAIQGPANSPVLVSASFTEDAAQSQTLVFVLQTSFIQSEGMQSDVMQTEIMQTGQRNPSGAVVWDLCVWQVTVSGPAQNRVELGVVAKSI